MLLIFTPRYSIFGPISINNKAYMGASRGWLKVIVYVPVAIPMKISTIDTGIPGKIVAKLSIPTPN